MHAVDLSPYRRSSLAQEHNQNLKALYALLGAGKEDVFHFTSSGGSAIRQIFFSHYMDFVRQTGRNHILTLPSADTSTQRVLKQCETLGCASKELPLNAQGQVTKQALIECIRPRSSLLSIPWAHGLTGVIQPLHDIAEVCKHNDLRLHIDATFAIGKLFFRFQDLGVDFLSIDGPLLRGPLGTGGFLVKSSILLERNDEELSPHFATLVDTIDSHLHAFDHLCTETARLRGKLEQGIKDLYPEAHLFFQQVERLPHCAVIAFPGIASDTLLYLLQKKGIYASQGGDHFAPLSSILLSYGIDPLLAYSALSFTLSHSTTEEEIDLAIQEIAALAKKIRPWSEGVFS